MPMDVFGNQHNPQCGPIYLENLTNVCRKLLILHTHIQTPSSNTYKVVTQHQPSDQGLKGNDLDEDVHMDGVSYSSTTF